MDSVIFKSSFASVSFEKETRRSVVQGRAVTVYAHLYVVRSRRKKVLKTYDLLEAYNKALALEGADPVDTLPVSLNQ
jgi:hypothetical protein